MAINGTGRNRVDAAAVFYAWIRAGLPVEPEKLWATPIETLLAALEAPPPGSSAATLTRRERVALRQWIARTKARRPRTAGLRAYQRIHELGATSDETTLLLSAGYHSAADLLVGGPKEFPARMRGQIKSGRIGALYQAAMEAVTAAPVRSGSLARSRD